MDKLDYLSEEMVEETLKEAADTFFGQRKRIDQEMDLIARQADRLRQKAALVEKKAASLNYLLPDSESTGFFWEGLGLADSIYLSIKGRWEEAGPLPWALSKKSRYLKSISVQYDELRAAVNEYLFGRYVDHPEIKGKKVITVNLSNLKKWAEYINEQIRQVNSSSNPDDVMAFTRRMNINENSKRESIGQGLEYKYQQDLCMKPLEFDSLELLEYPEIPGDKKALAWVEKAALTIFSQKKTRVMDIMNEIQKSR